MTNRPQTLHGAVPLFLALVALVVGAGSVAAQAPPSCQTGAVALTGAQTQLGRVFRDAAPSTCPSKPYPGTIDAASSFHYETFTFENTSAAAVCATVSFNPGAGAAPCGTNAHASAYLGSYDPLTPAAAFLGDAGISGAVSFAFEVPGASEAVVVVTNTESEEVCTFELAVAGLGCQRTGADLSLTKTASPPSPAPGSDVTFTVTVENLGPEPATGVTVTDVLPAGLTLVGTAGCAEDPAGAPTCTLGDLAAGASASYQLTATVHPAAPPTIVNSATASASSTDPQPANDTDTATLSVQREAAIPAAGTTGLVLLALLTALAGILVLRRTA